MKLPRFGGSATLANGVLIGLLAFRLPAGAVESGLDQLLSGPALALLNAARTPLVNAITSGERPTGPSTAGGSQFQSSGGRLIVAQVVHAMAGDAAQEKIYLGAIETALKSYEQQAVASHFSNDVGSAMALLVATADLAYCGKSMTDGQSTAVARQFQAALDTPEFRSASNQTKQQLYEFLATFGLYIFVTQQAALVGHNNDALDRLKPLAGEALRWLLGTPPEAIVITDQGISFGAVALSSFPVTVTKPTAVPASPTPAAAANSATTAAIVGIWHGAGISSEFNSITNASGTGVSSSGISSSLRGRDIAFLANGWFTSVIPSSGLARVDPAAAAVESPYYWGRYTFDGRHGTIAFKAGLPSTFEFVDGKILYDKFEFGTRRPIQ